MNVYIFIIVERRFCEGRFVIWYIFCSCEIMMKEDIREGVGFGVARQTGNMNYGGCNACGVNDH